MTKSTFKLFRIWSFDLSEHDPLLQAIGRVHFAFLVLQQQKNKDILSVIWIDRMRIRIHKILSMRIRIQDKISLNLFRTIFF